MILFLSSPPCGGTTISYTRGKAPDADILDDMISFAVEWLMELEIGAATGSGWGQKDPLCRRVHRNGYRDSDWEALAGIVELRISKLRK